jgi:hypothetical protein
MLAVALLALADEARTHVSAAEHRAATEAVLKVILQVRIIPPMVCFPVLAIFLSVVTHSAELPERTPLVLLTESCSVKGNQRRIM